MITISIVNQGLTLYPKLSGGWDAMEGCVFPFKCFLLCHVPPNIYGFSSLGVLVVFVGGVL